MGGLKGRGHPVGATGVYQIVKAVQQLRGQAGANQLARRPIGDDAKHWRQWRDGCHPYSRECRVAVPEALG